MTTRWPTQRLTIATVDFHGVVLATATVWGERYQADAGADFADTGQADFIARRPVVARADIRGYRPHVGQRLTDAAGDEWTITGVSPSDRAYGGGYTVDLEQHIAGAG